MKKSLLLLIALALLAGGCQGISGAEAGEALHQAWAEEADDFMQTTADRVDDLNREMEEVWASSAYWTDFYNEDLARYANQHHEAYAEELRAFKALPAPESEQQRREELLDAASGVKQWFLDNRVCIRTADTDLCWQAEQDIRLHMDRMLLTYSEILDAAPERPTS